MISDNKFSGPKQSLHIVAESILSNTSPIVILGEVGVGKSLVVKKAALDCLEDGPFELGVFIDCSNKQTEYSYSINLVLNLIIKICGEYRWLAKEIDIKKNQNTVLNNICEPAILKRNIMCTSHLLIFFSYDTLIFVYFDKRL